ncbi:protein kinase [Tritrichomonas foetus]|uniref:Protein kinase n=1 Tax=Tritrichomonas foetus TaxID=1144522 RepID=A0A1J4KDX3_9EUKA|nr:protein kinase [Tritrichomonas foetus]|eukprot:OHT07830.1 protein kinase [Tritrichomonas foetus]
MGAQLAANYDNIQQTFQFEFWNIHSASHRTTNENVSLWIIDNERFAKKFTTRNERDEYFELCLQSIQNIRKLRHPRILKILEVNEKKPDIAFASEPIAASLTTKFQKMHAMDAAYVSLQLAEALGFLNQDARLAHLGLTPRSVMLTSDMGVKLIDFQWSAPINSQGLVSIPDRLFSSRTLSEYAYKPPELLSKKEVTSQADIFIFGLFMYYAFTGEPLCDGKTPQDILNGLPTRICNIYNVPNDFKQLIQSCLSIEPSTRPSFLQILQSQAFQSMQLKALRYIDMILTKDPQDKFKFYKGLSTKIEDFSPTLTKIKILPVFINEIKLDVRFAPILLGPIFQIVQPFTQEEFMNLVWKQISFLTTIVNPPEVSIALLKNIKTIMAKIDKHIHKDHIYPIIFSALQSPDPRIHRECLSDISLIIEEMNENSIRTQILPRVLDLATNSTDSNIAASSILCVKQCLGKIDNDTFATEMLPRFTQIWQKARNATVAIAIVDTIEILRASKDIMMTRAIPIAAEIAGSHSIEGDIKMRLCDWMISTIRAFKDQRPATNYSVTKASFDADNPFGSSAPAQPSSIQASRPIENTFSMDSSKSSMNANDIFGSSSMGAPSKPSVSQANDVFGGNSGAQLNAGDIFGSSNPNPSQSSRTTSNTSSSSKPSQPNINIDVFGTGMGSNNSTRGSQSSGMNAADIFGSSQQQSQQRNNNPSTMDIFGPSQSKPQPQQQRQQSTNVYNSPDIDIFGPPTHKNNQPPPPSNGLPLQSNFGMGRPQPQQNMNMGQNMGMNQQQQQQQRYGNSSMGGYGGMDSMSFSAQNMPQQHGYGGMGQPMPQGGYGGQNNGFGDSIQWTGGSQNTFGGRNPNQGNNNNNDLLGYLF